MSYSRTAVNQLLSALDIVDGRLLSLQLHDAEAIRAAAANVRRSDEMLTVAEARGRHARIVALASEGQWDEARRLTGELHRDALLAIDKLPIGSAEAIELASLALKTTEVV